MINCNKNIRITAPSGLWDINQLIGAKVVIKSFPVSNFFGGDCTTGEGLTISDIRFQVSLDGKAITIIQLKEYPNKVFTWKDLEIVEINTKTKKTPICGTFLSDQSICGYNVDKSPSYINDIINGGLGLVDENGNIIINRYLRFTGGVEVEDPTIDTDIITDINIGGDILDK